TSGEGLGREARRIDQPTLDKQRIRLGEASSRSRPPFCFTLPVRHDPLMTSPRGIAGDIDAAHVGAGANDQDLTPGMGADGCHIVLKDVSTNATYRGNRCRVGLPGNCDLFHCLPSWACQSVCNTVWRLLFR